MIYLNDSSLLIESEVWRIFYENGSRKYYCYLIFFMMIFIIIFGAYNIIRSILYHIGDDRIFEIYLIYI